MLRVARIFALATSATALTLRPAPAVVVRMASSTRRAAARLTEPSVPPADAVGFEQFAHTAGGGGAAAAAAAAAGEGASTPRAARARKGGAREKGVKRSGAKRASPSADTDAPGPPTPRKRAASPPSLEPPAGWRATWELIVQLRADRTAVVDTMGAECAAAVAEPEERAYHTLISLMLSSQTKDTVNAMVMRRLRQHGLSVPSILATPDDALRELIYGVGFHNNKVRYIKEATRIIADAHAGRVPRSMDDVLALPGVGPKMAIILFNVAFGQCVGISVDTHVHRIANQLGWTGPEPTRTPEKTRAALEAWMPRDVWADVNLVLVGLGQEVQTEKAKLLGKCLRSSEPERALRLASTLGVAVGRELAKAGLDVPHVVTAEGL